MAIPQQPPTSFPMVSVLMVTYNQDSYIRAAMESVIMQEVAFEYEIVIGEDYSTDQTRTILLEYQQKYEKKIRLLFHEKNLGVSRNWEYTMHQCCGKYIAILEGDDYWTNPHKLQKQVDFMEAHPDFSMCFHNARILYEGSASPPASHLMTEEIKPEFTLSDVTGKWQVATASVMYRRALMPDLPAWVHDTVVVDLPLFATLASRGRVGFLNEEMSVYRVNSGGVTQTAKKETFLLNLIRMYTQLDQHLAMKQHRNLTQKVADSYLALASLMNSQHRHVEAKQYLKRAFKSLLSVRIIPQADMFKALAISLMPALYQRLYKR
jgi:glycosyltransferase involved in cell wall biosynthesis